MPVPTKKAENKSNFGMNTELALIEWEKNQIQPFFAALDVEKKRAKEANADAKTKPGHWLTKEQLMELFEKLKKDECIIGKEPDMSQL